MVDEVDSTNTELLAATDRPDRSVLAAGYQRAGRGRLDRRWEAPAGANLLVSILFRRVPTPAIDLTHRVALAAIDACEAVAGVHPRLKWPNDLLIGEAKLGGILAQQRGDGAIVVGLGLNVRWAPDGAVRLGEQFDPLDVLEALLVAYDRLPPDIHRRYQGELATLGQLVAVEMPDGRLSGRAVDVLPSGELVVVDECAISHRIDIGDVVHLRPSV